jgi:hypothetical protein
MTGSVELAAVSAASGMRVPDFFVLGNPKSGTTALYRMLRTHPEIYMPDLKEPWFFAPELQSRFSGPKTVWRPRTLEEYLPLFARAGAQQRVGEASSCYLMSRNAASGIAQVAPNARLIAILREPASFLRSLHLQNVQVHVDNARDLRRALELELERRAGRRIPRRSPRPEALFYSDHVRYVEQLRRYHELFAPERILVLIYDDFRGDNEATLRRVLRFLEVDDTQSIEPIEAGLTVGVRSQRLHEAVQSVSVGRGPVSESVKTAMKAVTSTRMRRKALRTLRKRVVFGAPPPPDEQLIVELRRRFAGEVAALSEYLDRDLVSLWGYDQLG